MSVEKEINETLLIKAVDLGNRDVQVYDLCEEGKTFTNPLNYPNDIIKITSQSVFRMVYNQAFEQISLMVNSSLNTKRQDIENIIAFAGRRGTGKTSAMYSLEKFLCNNEINFVNAENGSKVFKFIKLYDMKAADLKEDILEHIIEVIRYELDKYINNTNCLRFGLDFDKAKILRETACLMEKEYCSFKNNNSSSDFSYNSIMRTSNKLDMKHRFKTLIKDYSGLLSEDKNVFFIICIDDLDMASDNSKKLVQDIYKYLMIPNLIVFVTTDFSLLNSEIQKEFYENLCPSEDKGHIENLSMKQTHALLRKIIPSDNRITMPSWKKKDYIEMFPVKICFNKKDEKDYFTKYFPRLKDSEFEEFIRKCNAKDNDYCISPKDFILMLIANRTKIYLDVKGYKYHFMEPDSLRNLYDMFYLLYNMNNLIPEYEDYDALKKEYYNAKKIYENQLERANKKYIKEIKATKNDTLSVKRTEVSKPAIIDIYENKIASYYYHRSENRKRLLDYIHFTMREDMSFSSEESDFIDMLLAQPVERRGKMIWDRYFSILRTEQLKTKIVGTYGDDFYKEELAKSKIENYSFGELFRIIYTSTRLGVFEKKFVKFIIAIFSFSLPAFVERAKKEEKDEKHIPYKRLVDNFGYSFLGTWWDDLFVRNEYDIELESSIIINIKALKDASFSNIDNVENAITSLLYLLMLTSKKDNIIIKYKRNSNITIYSKPDPTAFIMNIMNIDARLEEPMFVFKNNESNYGESISMRKLISKILEIATIECNYEKILNQKVDELRANYRECHLSNMFKHMDLLYNVIKRVVSKKLYNDSNSLSKNENTRFNGVAYDLYKEFYDGIIEKLQENDEIYFANKQKPDKTNIYFSERFENSSIVKFFKRSDKTFNYSISEHLLGIRLGALPVNTFHRQKSKTFEEYVKSIENNFKDDMGTDLVLLIKLRLYNHLDKRINHAQEYRLNKCLKEYVLNKYNENKKTNEEILNETIDNIRTIIKTDDDDDDDYDN